MTSGSEPAVSGRVARWGVVDFRLMLALAAVFFVSLAKAQPAEPDDETRSAARQMARDALELLNAEKYAAAEDLLHRAYELVPAPTVAVLRGKALEALDRLIEAAESYELARRFPVDAATTAAFREARQEASERLKSLRGQIPLVVITATGVNAGDERLEIRLDDRVLPSEMVGVRLPVDPGQHLIIAAFDRVVHDARWVTLKRGEHVNVLMRVDAPKQKPPLPPPPPPPSPPHQKRFGRSGAGWLALGVGGGGFVTGMVAGGLMLDMKSKLDNACRPACPTDFEDELQTFRRSRTVSALGYGVGFTGLAVGGALLLAAPRECNPDPVAGSEGPLACPQRRRFFARIGQGEVYVGGLLP